MQGFPVFAILAALSGEKVRSRKLQKELTEMSRITTTLCVMAVLAMATLALPTPSYPTNAFLGFAAVLVCPKAHFPAAKVFCDLRSFDKMVVNSATASVQQRMLLELFWKQNYQ